MFSHSRLHFHTILCCQKSDESLCQEIPRDKTGNFETIYDFLDDHWKIIKWVALGAVIFEVSLRMIYMVFLGYRWKTEVMQQAFGCCLPSSPCSFTFNSIMLYDFWFFASHWSYLEVYLHSSKWLWIYSCIMISLFFLAKCSKYNQFILVGSIYVSDQLYMPWPFTMPLRCWHGPSGSQGWLLAWPYSVKYLWIQQRTCDLNICSVVPVPV